MSLHIEAPFAMVAWQISLAGDDEFMYTTIGIEMNTFGQTDVEAIHTNCSPILAGMLNVEYSVERVIVTAEDQILESTGAAEEGLNTGSPLPSNCALLIRKSTGRRGRSKQGRMYIPAPDEEQVGPTGLMDTGLVTAYQALADDLLTTLTGLTGVERVVLLHTLASEAPDTITALQVQPMIATQRRRMR